METEFSFLLIAGVLLLLLPLSLVHGKKAVKDLILYLSFDDDKGKEAQDMSKFGNHGEWDGNRLWVDGKFGTAVQIATDNAALIENPKDDAFALEGNAEITIMVWVNVDASRPGRRTIVYNRPEPDKVNYALGLKAVDIDFFYRDKENKNFHRVTGIWDSVKLGEWTHIAATNTFGDPEAMKVYLNGKSQTHQ